MILLIQSNLRAKTEQPQTTEIIKKHTVLAKETIYSLAKMYNATLIESIRKIRPLIDVLQVRQMTEFAVNYINSCGMGIQINLR